MSTATDGFLAAAGSGSSPAGRPRPAAGVRRRFTVCAALTAPVLLLSWWPLLQFPHWSWVASALALPVVGWGALPLHRAALDRLRAGAAPPEVLASLTALFAVGLSVQQLLIGAPEPGLAVPFTVVWGGGPGRLHLDVAVVVTTAALGVRAFAGAPRAVPPWFVPCVLLLATGAGGFWSGAGAGDSAALATALAVLVAAAPVAVALAEPFAVLAAGRAAAWRGTALTPDVVRSLGRASTVLVATDALDRPEALGRLRRLELDPVLLTADPPDVARRSADRAGLAAVAAGLDPAEQVAAVHRLQDAGCVVAVIGSDAAVLAAADVGIGLVRGAGDVVVAGPDAAADLLVLGRRCAAVARANTGLGLTVAALGTALAAGGLLHPAAAAATLGLGVALVGLRSLTAFHGGPAARHPQ